MSSAVAPQTNPDLSQSTADDREAVLSTCVAVQIPGCGIHHIWLYYTSNDVHQIVCVSSDTDGLLAQPSGAHFSRHGPAKLANSQAEYQGPEHRETSLSVEHA